ncbi:hypothetical protein R6Q57_004804 [Mikania cordata]
MSDEYYSQPALKSSAWILNKFRSRPSNTGPSSSNNEIPPEIPNPPKNPTVDNNLSGRKRSWAIPDNECDNWSEDVIEFLKHGDTPFCYSAVFFRDVKLDKLFWDLRNMSMVWYCIESESFGGDKYRSFVLPKLKQMGVYFSALLVNMCFWKKTRQPEGYLIFEVNDDFAQTDVSLAADEGLYVCMLMEHLVTGKPINASGDLKLELKNIDVLWLI